MGACKRYLFILLGILFFIIALLPMTVLFLSIGLNLSDPFFYVFGACTLPLGALCLLVSLMALQKAKAEVVEEIPEQKEDDFVSYQVSVNKN
jgi:hypothetical protein